MTCTDVSGSNNGLARLLTLPNLLSASRLLLLPPVLLLLIRGHSVAALSLMCLCWITDALDGYVARHTNRVTELGKALDHIVDKIWVGSVLGVLVSLRNLPIGLVIAVITRDLLIIAGSTVLLKRRGTLPSSDVVGKITGFAFALLILFYTLSIPALLRYKAYVDFAVIILIAVSFLNYLATYLRKMTRICLPGDSSL
ncbi:MAG: CDP-alcohol phosphatidyltransferase family protein [candidate division WOR-3 bacterium]